MANFCTCLCPPSQEQNESVTDFKQKVQGMENVQDLIRYIDQLMRKIESGGHENVSKPISVVASSINAGGTLIEELSKRLKWHLVKKCLLNALDRQTRKVLVDGLSQTQHIPFVGMGLSLTAHLLERAEQTSSNQEERLDFLRHLCALAKHMVDLDVHLHRPKLNEILVFIVNATVVCALQMEHNRLCRFISAPLDHADLQKLKSQLMILYPDLLLEAETEVLNRETEVLNTVTEVSNRVTEVSNRVPTVPGPSQGEYPDDAVGIEEEQKKVIELLGLKDPSPRIVVIFGVGGIGKTTLATAVFNRLDLSGYHHCRVFIDHDSKESNIPPLQARILLDLFGENMKFDNCTEGQEKLLENFRKSSKPVFLFVDNALRRRDLEMLLPIKKISGLPMRILVTTRDRNEIPSFRPHDGIQVHWHMVNPLSNPEAKRLLCHYALNDANSSFDPDVNMDGLLEICGGIPLVLQLVGSELSSRGITIPACNEIIEYFKEWQLTGLEGEREDLGERMVDFVYRRLREPSKEAFLDIAFFFYDWESSKVSDIVGETALRDLEGAALVTTSEDLLLDTDLQTILEKKMVKMHDIVRARARKLSKGNRIIDKESLVDLLGDEQKLQQTKGIWIHTDYEEQISVEAKHVDSMRRSLRVLRLGEGMRLNGRCERTFEQLRVLHISHHQDVLPMDPSNLPALRRLQVGLISDAELRIDTPKSLRCLRCYAPRDTSASVHISGHINSLTELILPNVSLANLETCISQLKSLHSLVLFCRKGFASISEILESFSSLKMMVLGNCSKLKRLPENFGNFSSLQRLHMFDCSKLEGLPESFGNLSSLQYLKLQRCAMLERLPESFVNLSGLRLLAMNGFSNIERLPESFGNLSGLQTLSMVDCSKIERLPESFGNLSGLQKLQMNGCSKIERLPESLGNLSGLQTLGIGGCSNIERLPESFGNLSGLQTLCMDYCKIERLPESFGNLSGLRTLVMNACSKIERLPESFGNLSGLQELVMNACSKIERLPESFGNLSGLQTLQMNDCCKIERLPESLGNLSGLQALLMNACSKIERLPESLGNLSGLQGLVMNACSKIERLPESLGNLSGLQTLQMNGCSKIERLPESLGNLSSIRNLNISNCSLLDRLPETFDQMSCLQTLKMDGLKMMCSLRQLKCLKFLSIRNCKDLKRVHDDIVSLTSLTAMKAYGCPELEAEAMDSLLDMKSLMFLEMGESPMLIKRWEEIQQQQHRPLIGAALRFDRDNPPYAEIMSTMLFNGASRFLQLDGDGKLAEVASSSFMDAGAKVGLLLTPCLTWDSLRHELWEVASQEYQIIYVDVDVEGEGEGSWWMEEREKRIRKMLMELPRRSVAWISPFRKTNLLFAFLLWQFSCGVTPVDASIVGTSVVVDEEGRKKLSHPLQTIFCDYRSHSPVQGFRTLFSPLEEAWWWMVGA